jgi:hypothetical protein
MGELRFLVLAFFLRVFRRAGVFPRNEPAKLDSGGSGKFEKGRDTELRVRLEAGNCRVEMMPGLRRFGPGICLRPEAAWIVEAANFNRQILRMLFAFGKKRDPAFCAEKPRDPAALGRSAPIFLWLALRECHVL